MRIFLLSAAIFLTAAAPAMAMDPHHAHKTHGNHAAGHKTGQSQMAATAKTKADRDLLAVTNKMHHEMDVALIGTPDADFMRAMIPHHQGAIDMANVVLKHGKDARVRWLAGNIIKAQMWEIGWMKRLLLRSNQPINVKTGNGAMAQSADTDAKQELLAVHHQMHAEMDVALTGEADADFIRAMIPHHQGAVDMAAWVLTHGRNTATRDLAREIIEAQTGEIAWMNKWLKKHHDDCGCSHHKMKH